MDVHWSLEGLSYRHTTAETSDPDCHTWQGPMGADELIVHAANLHIYRSGYSPQTGDTLWSLRANAQLEDRVRS